METKKGILVLAILAPLTAEIFNGSTGLFELGAWNVLLGSILPYSLLIIILAYLAQTAISRASILFLLPIAGIVTEGLIVKSFFNTSFSDLSVLGGVGVWGGVQWPWTLSLIASHTFVSFLIPLMAAMYLMHEVRVNKTAAYTSGGVLTVFIGWTTLVIPHMFAWYWVKLGLLALIIVLLVYLSRTVRLSSPTTRSVPLVVFFLVGLIFPIFNWITSFWLAGKSLMFIMLSQVVFMGAYLYFIRAQLLNERTSEYKKLAFIAGYYVLFAGGLIYTGLQRDMADFRLVGATLALGIIALLMFSIRRSREA